MKRLTKRLRKFLKVEGDCMKKEFAADVRSTVDCIFRARYELSNIPLSALVCEFSLKKGVKVEKAEKRVRDVLVFLKGKGVGVDFDVRGQYVIVNRQALFSCRECIHRVVDDVKIVGSQYKCMKGVSLDADWNAKANCPSSRNKNLFSLGVFGGGSD